MKTETEEPILMVVAGHQNKLNMKLIEQLSPIQFPELYPLDERRRISCRKECLLAVDILRKEFPCIEALCDENGTIYVWDNAELRLWLLGHAQAKICYFDFLSDDELDPICYHVESFLEKSRTNSFNLSKVVFSLTAYTIDIARRFLFDESTNDILPQTDGYPDVLADLEKKKILNASARKFLRHTYQQAYF